MAVPSSSDEVDWWAKPDGRYSRYARLFRVWSDPTDTAPQPFYRLWAEKHLVPALWENFALFEPRFFVAELYRLLDFSPPSPATDIGWSYEFNLRPGGRQLDIVIHVRFQERDEVIIGEAKPGKKPFAPKDVQPEDVLSEEDHRQWPRYRRGGGRLCRDVGFAFGDRDRAADPAMTESHRAKSIVMIVILVQFLMRRKINLDRGGLPPFVKSRQKRVSPGSNTGVMC